MPALLLALLGLAAILTGLYLWLGLPATLIAFGLACVYTAVRLEMTRDESEPVNPPDSQPIP
jgi:hypothetical protein